MISANDRGGLGSSTYAARSRAPAHASTVGSRGFAWTGFGERPPVKTRWFGFVCRMALTSAFLGIILDSTDTHAPKGFTLIAIGLGLI
jgi:hypothetical protein